MLFELKNYIGIDYDDRDVTLLLHLKASKRYFKNNYGVEEKDFDEDESIKELLFERCRYADANGLEMFEPNFKSDLLNLAFRMAVNKRARSKDDTEETAT